MSSKRIPASDNSRAETAPIVTRKTQFQRLNRGWRISGANDALLKLPSITPDSAARFIRTVSLRLKTHSDKSHPKRRKNTPPFNSDDKVFALEGRQQAGVALQTGRGLQTEGGLPTRRDLRIGGGSQAGRGPTIGGGLPADIYQTVSSSETLTDRTIISSKTENGFNTGNYRTLPSNETRDGLTPSRSSSMADFFRRVHWSQRTPKSEHTKRAKVLDDISQSARIDSERDEYDSGWKRTSIFHGFGSLRSRNRNYKSLEDGGRPLDGDTSRNSFREKLKKEVQRPTSLRTRDETTARSCPAPRETRGAVSDGEEEVEKEDSESLKGHRNLNNSRFQRTSAIWRSFSAKSRTRSSDVLLEAKTERRERNSGCLQREDFEMELQLLSELQEHRRLGFLVADGFKRLQTQHLRFVGLPEQRNFRSSNDIHPCPSTKTEFPGPSDRQGYRHTLDGLYEFNIAHAHYTEAAFVLCEHAQWCTSAHGGLPEGDEEEEWRRWELLLLRAVEDFDLGSTWEYAIEICEFLAKIYKAKFMYAELSLILQKQATLYRKILQEPRTTPRYFMVQFLGTDLPEFLIDKRFVLRTETIEDDYDLSKIISHEFEGAKRLDPNEPVGPVIQRGYRLFSLKPVPSVSIPDPGTRKVPDAVQFFHRYNNVDCFEVCDGESKSVVRIQSSLPGISRWALVTS